MLLHYCQQQCCCLCPAPGRICVPLVGQLSVVEGMMPHAACLAVTVCSSQAQETPDV